MFTLYLESNQGRPVKRTALCWPRIYLDILQNAPFHSQIFRVFFALSGKGALTPVTKILRTFLVPRQIPQLPSPIAAVHFAVAAFSGGRLIAAPLSHEGRVCRDVSLAQREVYGARLSISHRRSIPQRRRQPPDRAPACCPSRQAARSVISLRRRRRRPYTSRQSHPTSQPTDRELSQRLFESRASKNVDFLKKRRFFLVFFTF